jgi:hypothetical protein
MGWAVKGILSAAAATTAAQPEIAEMDEYIRHPFA